jgi:hypothetical protein
MDNLVNSLVTKTIGLTDQQVVSKLLANPNMNDSQIVQLMKSNGISPSQMSRVANIPEGQIAARVAATIPQGSSATLGDTVIVPQYRTTGSGMDEQIGPLEGFATSKSNGDPNYKAPVGTPMQMYSADGQFVSTVKTKKDQSFFGGLVDALKDPVVQAAILGIAGGAGAFDSLLGGTGAAGTGAGSAFELANAGAGAFEGGTALNTLAGTGAGSAFEAANAGATAMTDLGASELANAGATALSDLGASELANAGASANTVGGTTAANTAATAANAATAATAANAATTANAANAAKTLIDPITGLAISAAGNVLGNVANQEGINNARNAITQGSATANTALNKSYTDALALNAAGRTDLSNNYQNLNTNLNNTLNAQAGIYDRTNQSLYNNYSNLGTNLTTNLTNQVGQYDTANQGIKANAATQLALLGSTYQGQKDQAAANAAALNANYGNTRGDLYNIYNQQVGIQQPYQNVGQAGSQGLINNQDYLTRQFNANDLNSNLAPNYAFQLQQGQMANQRLGNMGGGAIGGNVARGLQDYTQNYASGAYQNAFNNFNTQRQNIYSTLAGMANIGTTSGGQLASLGNTLGGNLGSLSNTLGGNLTSNTGNLINAGTAYGSNTAGVTNNLNNVLSSNLGQLQGAYNQYGSNLTGASNTYGGNMINNANQLQGAYNQYGTNLLGGSTNFANNLTTNTGVGVNAANVYGLNTANLATGTAAALASNATASGANNATALSNLGNTALLGSMIKAT